MSRSSRKIIDEIEEENINIEEDHGGNEETLSD